MFLIFCSLPIGRKLWCEGTLPVGWEHHGSRFRWKMCFNNWCWLVHKAEQTFEKWLDLGSTAIQLLSSGRWGLCEAMKPQRRKGTSVEDRQRDTLIQKLILKSPTSGSGLCAIWGHGQKWDRALPECRCSRPKWETRLAHFSLRATQPTRVGAGDEAVPAEQ